MPDHTIAPTAETSSLDCATGRRSIPLRRYRCSCGWSVLASDLARPLVCEAPRG